MQTFKKHSSPAPCGITIGNFDGVHRGHQFLVQHALAFCAQTHLDCVVLTFWPHPRNVLSPDGLLPLVSSRSQRLRYLKELGVEKLIELPFTPEVAKMSPRDFVSEMLMPLHPACLVVGHDFSLGKQKSGNIAVLQQIGKELGFGVEQVPPVYENGQVISSTRIRHCLLEGDVVAARQMLGRHYGIEGQVVHGDGRGAGLGFPTANLAPSEVVLPANGVYACKIFVGDSTDSFHAVTNIGDNPTFNVANRRVESFLIDTQIDLYGKQIRVDFVDRLRDERKFASADALVQQIKLDVRKARGVLGSIGQ